MNVVMPLGSSFYPGQVVKEEMALRGRTGSGDLGRQFLGNGNAILYQ